jgi:hypothetical protein
MTPYRQESQISDKRYALSLIFKDILCSKRGSEYISPFLQSILVPLEVFRYPRETNNKNQRIPILRGI